MLSKPFVCFSGMSWFMYQAMFDLYCLCRNKGFEIFKDLYISRVILTETSLLKCPLARFQWNWSATLQNWLANQIVEITPNSVCVPSYLKIVITRAGKRAALWYLKMRFIFYWLQVPKLIIIIILETAFLVINLVPVFLSNCVRELW